MPKKPREPKKPHEPTAAEVTAMNSSDRQELADFEKLYDEGEKTAPSEPFWTTPSSEDAVVPMALPMCQENYPHLYDEFGNRK